MDANSSTVRVWRWGQAAERVKLPMTAVKIEEKAGVPMLPADRFSIISKPARSSNGHGSFRTCDQAAFVSPGSRGQQFKVTLTAQERYLELHQQVQHLRQQRALFKSEQRLPQRQRKRLVKRASKLVKGKKKALKLAIASTQVPQSQSSSAP
ncbi:unnamed protein product [Sympodiomycopsis kandeliae]